MKDTLKIIAALIPLGKSIFKSIKKAKDEKEKQKILEALRTSNIVDLNKLLSK